MLPGPNIVYKCPDCSGPVRCRSLISGNTIGAVYYSDGSMDAWMLPDIPKITKCPQCGMFFWLNKGNKVAEPSEEMEWGSPYAEFPTAEGYIDASEIFASKKERSYLRIKAWQAFNRAYTEDEGKDVYGSTAYRNNCTELLMLLDDDGDEDSRLMSAELYRNLGEFEKCLEIVKTLPKELSRLKKQFISACEKKRIETYELRMK